MHAGNEGPLGSWIEYEIVNNGSDLELLVNGLLQNHVWDVEQFRGAIALQAEGGRAAFRNVVLTPLEKSSGDLPQRNSVGHQSSCVANDNNHTAGPYGYRSICQCKNLMPSIRVFLPVVIWRGMWGMMGVFLAVPILIAVTVIGNKLGAMGPVSAVLSGSVDADTDSQSTWSTLSHPGT